MWSVHLLFMFGWFDHSINKCAWSRNSLSQKLINFIDKIIQFVHIPWPFTPACFNNLYDNYNVHKVFSPTFGFSFFLLIRWAKMFTGSWYDQFFIRIFPDSTSKDTKALCFKHGKSWVNWIARNMMFEYKTRIPHRKIYNESRVFESIEKVVRSVWSEHLYWLATIRYIKMLQMHSDNNTRLCMWTWNFLFFFGLSWLSFALPLLLFL